MAHDRLLHVSFFLTNQITRQPVKMERAHTPFICLSKSVELDGRINCSTNTREKFQKVLCSFKKKPKNEKIATHLVLVLDDCRS